MQNERMHDDANEGWCVKCRDGRVVVNGVVCHVGTYREEWRDQLSEDGESMIEGRMARPDQLD